MEKDNNITKHNDNIEVPRKAEKNPHKQTITIQQGYSGPIPPPAMMEAYKKVDESLPKEIVEMSRDNLRHLHHIDKVEVYTESITSILGVLCGFGIGLFVVYEGAQVAISGHPVAGTLLAGGGLSTLVGTFIYGTRSLKRIAKEQEK